MLSEIAIVEINNQLSLCDSYLLTELEIDRLNATGSDPQTTCEYYNTTQQVLDERAKTDTSISVALDVLVALAAVDGCEITLETPPVPDVDVPFFGGSIG